MQSAAKGQRHSDLIVYIQCGSVGLDAEQQELEDGMFCPACGKAFKSSKQCVVGFVSCLSLFLQFTNMRTHRLFSSLSLSLHLYLTYSDTLFLLPPVSSPRVAFTCYTSLSLFLFLSLSSKLRCFFFDVNNDKVGKS